jgi:TonB family protein
MKAASQLAIVLGLGLSVASFASAKSLEQTYLDNCRKGPGIPVPVAVVAPRVPAGLIGSEADVEFTVTASGKPSAISIRSSTDPEFATAVIDAVKQWKFAPAQKDGVAVDTKVVLPIKIVDASEPNAFAAN